MNEGVKKWEPLQDCGYELGAPKKVSALWTPGDASRISHLIYGSRTRPGSG